MTVTLPMFSKGQEQRAVGSARAARLRAELDAARTRVQLEVRAAFDAYNRRLAAVRRARSRSHPWPRRKRTAHDPELRSRPTRPARAAPDPSRISGYTLSIFGRSFGGCVGPDRSGCQCRNTAMTVKTFVIFVACVALVACGRRSEETAKPAAATPNGAERRHAQGRRQHGRSRRGHVARSSHHHAARRIPRRRRTRHAPGRARGGSTRLR